jgi:hypothetical protein
MAAPATNRPPLDGIIAAMFETLRLGEAFTARHFGHFAVV